MPDRVRETGRQIKGGSLELIARKGPGHASVAFLDATKNEIAYRWLRAGQSTREISRGLNINNREAVESALRDALASAPARPFIVRRAA